MAKDKHIIKNAEITFKISCPNCSDIDNGQNSVTMPLELVCTELEGQELLLTYYNLCTTCHNSQRYILLKRKIALNTK